MIKTVGIFGYGHFGKFVYKLGQTLFPEVAFKVYSRRTEVDGDIFHSLEDTAACDVLVLCGSMSEYKEQLQLVLEHMSDNSFIVDIATVKKHTGELLKKYAAGKKYVCTHPMFGPESYAKQNNDVTGFRIVVTESTLSDELLSQARNLFASLGFLIIEMSADEHDELLAETLFLTHFIGQTVIKADFKRTSIDTVSFQYLMDAVESVSDDKALFADVYRFNPYCEKVVERLRKAQTDTFKLVQEVPE